MRRAQTYGSGGGAGGLAMKPTQGATILMGAVVLLTLAASTVPALLPWLTLRPGALSLPTALVANTFVAAPASLINLVIFMAILGFFFQDRVRYWWAQKRVEFVLGCLAILVGLHLVGLALNTPGLGYGLGVALLLLAMFGTAVELQWGMKRTLLFSLFVLLAANIVGAFLFWQWPGLMAAATGKGVAPVNGTHPLSDGLLTAWCLMHGRMRLAMLNIEARKLVWVLVAINVLNFLFAGRLSAMMGLTAIGTAWLLIHGNIHPATWYDRFRLWQLERKHERRKSKLTVIDGGKTIH